MINPVPTRLLVLYTIDPRPISSYQTSNPRRPLSLLVFLIVLIARARASPLHISAALFRLTLCYGLCASRYIALA
jgi:hypothetical protein